MPAGKEKDGAGENEGADSLAAVAGEADKARPLILPFADTTDDCLKVAAVWISSATIGAMIGTFTAVFSGRPPKTIELWTFWGTATGTALGFPLMLCAIVALTR